tara:strand:- start:4026 stop:4193 length:168 start_codon:yes stop_codon:yes gene_type:complete
MQITKQQMAERGTVVVSYETKMKFEDIIMEIRRKEHRQVTHDEMLNLLIGKWRKK